MPWGILNTLFNGGTRADVPAQDTDIQIIGTQTITNDHLMTGAAMQMQAQQQAMATTAGGAQNQPQGLMDQGAYQTYRYQNVITYHGDYVDTMHYAQRPPEPPRPNISNAINDLAAIFYRQGMTFNEISVPRETFLSLYERLAIPTIRFFDTTIDPMIPQQPPAPPNSFNIATVFGYIKITCEQQGKFNLQDYLEVVND